MSATEAVKTKTKCTPRCWNAKSKKCKCSCAGENHGCTHTPNLFTGSRPQNIGAIHPKYQKLIGLEQEPVMKNDSVQGYYLPEREVYLMGKRLDPSRSQKLNNHSPDGFNWGYGGSGVAQLALAILLELMDDQRAMQNYQQFKWDMLATLEQGKDFEIPMAAVRKWIEEHTEIRYATTN